MTTILGDRTTIGSLTFNDRLAYPLPGLMYWCVDMLSPWDDTAEVQVDFQRIETVDGETPGESSTYPGKQYTIGGYVLAEDRETAEAAWDLIARDVMPRGRDVQVLREGPIPKFTTVRMNGLRSVDWRERNCGFRWSVSSRAYDPLRYAVTPWEGETGVAGQASGGRTYPRTYPMRYMVSDNGQNNRLEVVNLGTADTPKVFINLTGPLPLGAWRIVNETTGALLKYDIEVPSGQTLAIDMAAELATLAGASVTAPVTGDFFRLAPGVNVLRLFSEYDEAARMSVVAYSAWE